MSERDEAILADIRKRNEERKAAEESGTIGGARTSFDVEFLLRYIDAQKPRIITDEDGSDSLPVGSIVLDFNGDTARKFPGGWRTTVTEPDGTAWLSGCMEDAELPATVLHEPEPQP